MAVSILSTNLDFLACFLLFVDYGGAVFVLWAVQGVTTSHTQSHERKGECVSKVRRCD